MKIIFSLLILVPMVTLVLSCTMNRQTQVVERSKKDAPSWIEQPSLELRDNDAARQMLMVRKEMRDLPLAIKQTQFQALANMKRQLLDSLADPVRGRLAEGGDNIAAKKELDALLEELGRNEIWHQVRVEDIYYETLASQGPITGDAKSTHNVYVLVRMANEDYQRLVSLFQSLLGRAKTAELNQIDI
ncbi:MAG: hypothetical protein ACOH5I_03815 [Oligoflexus sp.]